MLIGIHIYRCMFIFLWINYFNNTYWKRNRLSFGPFLRMASPHGSGDTFYKRLQPNVPLITRAITLAKWGKFRRVVDRNIDIKSMNWLIIFIVRTWFDFFSELFWCGMSLCWPFWPRDTLGDQTTTSVPYLWNISNTYREYKSCP